MFQQGALVKTSTSALFLTMQEAYRSSCQINDLFILCGALPLQQKHAFDL